ncbi:MAG: hypothetical protein IKH47_03770 [Bacteroidaceae bacterium]|nr:hypothetical protein [Bacteroidaceae bacterium]
MSDNKNHKNPDEKVLRTYIVVLMLKAWKHVSCFSPNHSEAAMPHFIGKTKKNNYDDENGNNLNVNSDLDDNEN